MADFTINLKFDPDWVVSKTKTPEFCDKGSLRSVYQREILGRYDTLKNDIIIDVMRLASRRLKDPLNQDSRNEYKEQIDYLIQLHLLRLLLNSGIESHDGLIVVAHLTKSGDIMEHFSKLIPSEVTWGLFALSEYKTQKKMLFDTEYSFQEYRENWAQLFILAAETEGNTGLYERFESEIAGIIKGMNTCLNLNMPTDQPLMNISFPEPEPTPEDLERLVGKNAVPGLPNDTSNGQAYNQMIPAHYGKLMNQIIPAIADLCNRSNSENIEVNQLRGIFGLCLQFHLLKLIYNAGSQDPDAITIVAHMTQWADIWDHFNTQTNLEFNWLYFAMADRENRLKILRLIDAKVTGELKSGLEEILRYAENSFPNARFVEQLDNEVAGIVHNMNVCLGIQMDLSDRIFDVEPFKGANAQSNNTPLDSLPRCCPVSDYHPARYDVFSDPALADRLKGETLYIDGRVIGYNKIDNMPMMLFQQSNGNRWGIVAGLKLGQFETDISEFDNLTDVDLRLFGRYWGITNDRTPLLEIAISGGILAPGFGAFFCSDVFDILLKNAGMSRKDFIDSPV